VWDYINTELDITNYVKLYTSRFIEMTPGTDGETQMNKIDHIINNLAHVDVRYKHWGIHSCDITPSKDIVLGLRDSDKAQKVADSGRINLTLATGTGLNIPCGPLVPHGLLNCKRYEIACRTSPIGAPINLIVAALNAETKVHEVIVGNSQVDNHSIPIGQNGFKVYAEFPTLEAALDFPRSIKVEGVKIQLWHRGAWKCKQCGKKGHTDSHCAKMSKAIKQNKRRRKAFRNRQEQRARNNL